MSNDDQGARTLRGGIDGDASSEDRGQICVARDQDNISDTRYVPIIFVPGVMGSRLRFANGGASYDWDPDRSFYMARTWIPMNIWRQRTVFRDWAGTVIATSDDRNARENSRGWGTVAQDSYLTILDHLHRQTFTGFLTPVYAVGYDWRQSNRASGDFLVNRVNELVGSSVKVILVTHSMGGLVARAACHWHPDFARRVVGIVHTVQPALGASVAYWRFHAGGGDAGVGLDQILGNVWDKYTALMSVLSGPLQLLPNNHFRLPADTTTYHFGSVEGLRQPVPWLQIINRTGAIEGISSIYDVYRRSTRPGICVTTTDRFDATSWRSVLTDLHANLADAESFHAGLGLYAHDNTSVVVSNDHSETNIGFVTREYSPGGQDADRFYWPCGWIQGPGDGTVPEASARGIPPMEDGMQVARPETAEPSRRLTTGGEHSTIFSDRVVVQDFVAKNVRYMLQKAAGR